MTIKSWQWQVATVTINALANHLADGWEPFAATINVHGQNVYHLKRKVAVHG